MPSKKEISKATFLGYLETIDLPITELQKGETIRDKRELKLALDHPGIGDLPTISYTEDGEEQADIVFRKLLGVGGMGEVWQADQVPLKRSVAVKRLHSDAKNPATIQRNLLREAWTAGRLEHPNIVPVHALGLDEHGKPLLVMKRIFGSDWRELIYCPWVLPQRYQNRPTLDVHLELLMKVCDAVHFAHSRGVLHRDLKPENVMVGDYGEVYLLDWGIAVGMEGTTFDGIPMARDVTHPTGTPGYMAPEMVYPELGALGVHSDVYCLGAILHEVMTGSLRHEGKTTQAIFLDTFNTKPIRYDVEKVPKRLGEICNRATSLEPSERYATVETFRQDLQQYIQQRDSLVLVAQAMKSLRTLETAVSNRDDQLVSELYGGADFGLRRALQIWSENKEAKEAYQTLNLVMVRFEVVREQPAMGHVYLRRVEQDRPSVEQECLALEQQLAKLDEDLQKRADFERDLDLRVFTKKRAGFVLVLFLPMVLPAVIRHFYTPSIMNLIVGQVLMFTLVCVLLWMSRRWVFQTLMNRSLAIYLVWSSTLILAGRILGWSREFPLDVLSSVEFLIFVTTFMYLAILADKRLLAPFSVLALVLFNYVLWSDSTAYLATALFNGCGLLTIIIVWFRDLSRSATPEHLVESLE